MDLPSDVRSARVVKRHLLFVKRSDRRWQKRQMDIRLPVIYTRMEESNETLYYIACRKAVLTIWAVYTLVFFLTRVTGDPIEWLTLAGASDSAKEILRTNLGLGYAAVAAVHKIIGRALYGGYRNELLLCTFCFRSLRRAYDSTISLGSIVLDLPL